MNRTISAILLGLLMVMMPLAGCVSDGTDGVQGPEGPEGPEGPPGADGADGSDGDSAYQVAVNEGFVGDEAAWLASLVGPAGADGSDGADGADGDSAYQVAVSEGFVGDEAAWLASLVGPAGADGSDGADGADGTSYRRQRLAPWLPDSVVGSWQWITVTNYIMGGYWYNVSAAINDRLNFENVVLTAGPAILRIMHTTAGTGGIISVYWGTDKLAEFDARTGSTGSNTVIDVNLGTIAATDTKQLSFRIEASSGSGYLFRAQDFEILQPEA